MNAGGSWLGPRRAVQLLIAGVVVAAAVTLIFAVARPAPHPTPPSSTPAPTFPAAPSQPVIQPRPSPTPVPVISSTVTARPPLALYYGQSSSSGDEIALLASTDAGRPAGTLTIPYTDNGYLVAPDGSKVLDGNEIISVTGSILGHIAWTSANLPTWADDSDHLCGVPDTLDAPAQLVVFDMSGASRVVARVGSSAINVGWTVLACSPSADRAVLMSESSTAETIVTVRLSSGALLSTHTFAANDTYEGAMASHDGRIVAINESTEIDIHETSTWALLARVVRWGSQEGYPIIGAAIMMSWDGSRILVDGGGAGGGEHPMWIVNWAANRNVLTTASSPDVFVGSLGAIVALTVGSEFLIPSGDGHTYLLQSTGRLVTIS